MPRAQNREIRIAAGGDVGAETWTEKRTYPIKDGRIDPDRLTYLGDGARGTFVVGGAKDERWFWKKTIPMNHFFLVTLHGRKAVFEAINLRHQIIDRFEPQAR